MTATIVPPDTIEAEPARALEVRLPRLERDHVRMVDGQLGDVLDEHDAVALVGLTEEGGEQCGLAGTGRGDDEA